jgi:CheY-like chemotaxis protein
MSHELRSPLNSLLLLAEQLRQNRDQNLTEKQVEMVRVMHASGNDLLHLINDILDLSKIEAGSATLEIGDVDVNKLASDLDKGFRYQAEAKGLAFTIDFANALPPILRTDGQRLKQVLTNLLSNAVKFTSKGSVSLSARVAREGWNPANPGLAHAPLVIAFSVRDSGIGIAANKMRLIFEAFQQADASTSRRYGGTGLGLAISREIARLLDGELDVASEEGVGSTFTFYLPQQLAGVRTRPQPAAMGGEASAVHATPRAAPHANPLLLIIEDDPVFARTLQDMAHDRGFDTLVASSGEEGFQLARRDRPDAITLDLELPDVDGWDIADRLKAEPLTSDIAVHVISVRDRPQRGARHGVASYTTKPADLATLGEVFAELTAAMERPLHVLLLIENDLVKRNAIMAALAGPDRAFDTVASAAEALAALRNRAYQGVVVELELPGQDGLTLLQQIRSDPQLAAIPAVLYSERELDAGTLEKVRLLDATVVGEGVQLLVDHAAEVALFLQRVKSRIPAPPQPPPSATATVTMEADDAAYEVLHGKCVLIVDDDARNLFALTGLLENYRMNVIAVENGEEAIKQLETHGDIDVVLMDIMMPDMDGYETTRRIRADTRFAKLPIIALTAKAMAEDRTKCLAAGASDYASKPVDTRQLLTQLSVWLAAGVAS